MSELPEPITAIDLLELATLGELARRWACCEATVRNTAKRLFPTLPRVGRAHVLNRAQAEQLHAELARRGLVCSKNTTPTTDV